MDFLLFLTVLAVVLKQGAFGEEELAYAISTTEERCLPGSCVDGKPCFLESGDIGTCWILKCSSTVSNEECGGPYPYLHPKRRNMGHMYEKGECVYLGGAGRAWCATPFLNGKGEMEIVTDIRQYSATAGINSNWDFCNCEIGGPTSNITEKEPPKTVACPEGEPEIFTDRDKTSKCVRGPCMDITTHSRNTCFTYLGEPKRCQKLYPCCSTEKGPCRAFTYLGVKYELGECAYVGGGGRPWCYLDIEELNDKIFLSSGEDPRPWAYCNCPLQP